MKNLAEVLRDLNRFEEAESLYNQSLDIWEKNNLSHHRDETLVGLAALQKKTGSLDEARATLEQALEVRAGVVGEAHPEIGPILRELSLVHAEQGAVSQAMELALQAEKTGREHLRVTARTLPERQALRYATARASGIDIALSLADRSGSGNLAGIWDAVLRSRAAVLDEMAFRRRTLYDTSATEVAELTREFEQASRILAKLLVTGPDPHHPEDYLARLTAARDRTERAERILAERVLPFRETLDSRRIGFEDVARALPVGTSLVAVVQYDRHDFGERILEAPTVPSYAALVLAGPEHGPRIVDLGEAEAIDRTVAEWREEVARGAEQESADAVDLLTDYRRVASRLRHQVWDPIAAILGRARQVLIVPDGQLNLINFAALPASDDRYLAEADPLIHLYSAERDLVRRARAELGTGLLVLGGLDFDLAERGRSEGASTFRGQRALCDSLREASFAELPAAQVEAERVMDLWQRTQGSTTPREALHLSGATGTEAAFKRLASGRRVIHLATHGFFLDDCDVDSEGTRGIGRPSKRHPGALPPTEIQENPLKLSGLVLSGANGRDEARAEEEDGILTAGEIAALNLSGVEWAVLSACETGLGEIESGEGVFGLRRAFHVAGVQTVIMSLWNVDDESTLDWMEALYVGRLERKMTTPEAMRFATGRELERRRTVGQSTHPYFWGAWVAAGGSPAPGR